MPLKNFARRRENESTGYQSFPPVSLTEEQQKEKRE